MKSVLFSINFILHPSAFILPLRLSFEDASEAVGRVVVAAALRAHAALAVGEDADAARDAFAARGFVRRVLVVVVTVLSSHELFVARALLAALRRADVFGRFRGSAARR